MAFALVAWLQPVYAESLDFIINSRDSDAKPFEHKLKGRPQTIDFSAALEMPTSEDTVPWLHFYFENSRGREVAKMWIDDPECTGEFHSRAQYSISEQTFNVRYFNEVFPWPEQTDVTIQINKKDGGDYVHSLTVNDEMYSFKTYSKLRKLKMKSFGLVEISGFTVKQGAWGE